MKRKDMHTSLVRTRQQLKNEKSRKCKTKVKYIKPTVEACNVDKEQELQHETIRMPCAENEMLREANEMREEVEMLREEVEIGREENIDAEMEINRPNEVKTANIDVKKRPRGPTKVKKLPLSLENRIEVEVNEVAIPIGDGSVHLSSYLGPLVREHVPVTLGDWRLLSDELKVVLWESIQARFKLEELQKISIFQQMGTIWRSSKSKLVRKIVNATTEEERLGLKPYNIKNMNEWRKFVKAKLSLEFTARSEKYRAIRQKQLPHTTGRRGIARFTDDLKKQSQDSSFISRMDVWVKSHTKKNGELVNTDVANVIEEIKKIDNAKQSDSINNVQEDAIAQILGQDKPGRLRALGRGYTKTKLALSQSRDKQITQFQKRISELENIVHFLMNKQSKTSSAYNKCKLYDWNEGEVLVAEGRLCSSDPKMIVNGIPLGPSAMVVWVDCAKKEDAFLWRPTIDMSCIKEAVGKKIAWPKSKVVTEKASIVASPSKAIATSPWVTKSTHQSSNMVAKNRCKLIDVGETGQVVAEGTIVSTDPTTMVHCVPLGKDAVKVWVNFVKVNDALLWRPTSECTYMEDAFGTTVAWPAPYVIGESNFSDFSV